MICSHGLFAAIVAIVGFVAMISLIVAYIIREENTTNCKSGLISCSFFASSLIVALVSFLITIEKRREFFLIDCSYACSKSKSDHHWKVLIE